MVYEIVRKALLASLGVQEKMKAFVDDLVKKGELSEGEGAKLMKEWIERAKASTQDVNRIVSEGVSMGFDKVNIATKDELDALTKKVQQLSVRVKKLESGAKPAHED
ncbi:MAG TPA: hypothetical protein VJM83_03480 [Nitrospirota bacterium]|nr:hypothetical protein [Nitrospirota bacterium]